MFVPSFMYFICCIWISGTNLLIVPSKLGFWGAISKFKSLHNLALNGMVMSSYNWKFKLKDYVLINFITFIKKLSCTKIDLKKIIIDLHLLSVHMVVLPSMDMSGSFSVHLSAKSLSNIYPKPSEVITKV